MRLCGNWSHHAWHTTYFKCSCIVKYDKNAITLLCFLAFTIHWSTTIPHQMHCVWFQYLIWIATMLTQRTLLTMIFWLRWVVVLFPVAFVFLDMTDWVRVFNTQKRYRSRLNEDMQVSCAYSLVPTWLIYKICYITTMHERGFRVIECFQYRDQIVVLYCRIVV